MAMLLAALLAPGGHPAGAQQPPPAGIPLAVADFNLVAVDFDFVSIREPRTATIRIRNLGSAELLVSSITSTNPTFVLGRNSLPPIAGGGGSTDELLITFSPTQAGVQEGEIIFESNDPFHPVFRMPVRGEGTDVVVAIQPAQALLVPGQSFRYFATVTGTSSTGVSWSVLSGGGSIDAGGVYTAPAGESAVTIQATSQVDPTATSTASALITTPELGGEDPTLTGPGRFGTAVATADLDGDGQIEVISGVPGADAQDRYGTVAGGGAVWINTFNTSGFSATPILLQSPKPVAGGAFGQTVLVRDLDDDGNLDLVVGEPGGNGAAAGSGAVHVWYGDGAGGFDPQALSFGAPSGAAGDRFGSSLATGYFSNDNTLALAVGAPGTTIDYSGAPIAAAGAVHVVGGLSDRVPTYPVTGITQPQPQPGAGFGGSLASLCLEACTAYGIDEEKFQLDGLVAGAPDATVITRDGSTLPGAGRVFAYRADHSAPVFAFFAGEEVHNPVPAANARFGSALSAGDTNGDVAHDLAIGAPAYPVTVSGIPVNSGMVFMFLSDGAGRFSVSSYLRDANPVNGGRFGANVLLSPIDDNDLMDLTVGIPGNGSGRVELYFAYGDGDFNRMRLFSPDTATSEYGTVATWADLNRDGATDLIIGVPGATVSGTLNAGQVAVELDLPPAPVSIYPPRTVLSRQGRDTTKTFTGSVPSALALWEVVGDGSIDAAGVFTAPFLPPADRLATNTLVRLRDSTNDNHWALARVRLHNQSETLIAPELIENTDGSLTLGFPEEGTRFGSAVGIAPIGRAPGDPNAGLMTVFGGFPASVEGVLPRLNSYPYSADIVPPFGSLRLYPSRFADSRTGWGFQTVSGDFDGNGTTDLAISAPFAPSLEGESQVGFIDIYFLEADGERVRGPLRIAPSAAMSDQWGNPLWTSGNTRANSRYGYRMAVRDLNGDNRDDLIIGAPHADVAGLRDAGLVEVLMAPASGDWYTGFSRATLISDTPTAGAYFGSAITIANITGSGAPELFVGAPGRDPETREYLLFADPAVYGFKPIAWNGTDSLALRATLAGADVLAIADPGTEPDGRHSGFGLALAAGNLVGNDAADELAVGIPFRTYSDPKNRDHLGVPRVIESGQVMIYDTASPGGFTVGEGMPVLPPVRQPAIQFGSRLAVGHMTNATGAMDLVVGTPYLDTFLGANTGGVLLFEGTTSGPPRYRDMILPPSLKPLDLFGQAIAVGDIDQDGIDELVGGAPNASIRVVVGYEFYPGRFGGTIQIVETRQQAGKVYVLFQGMP